MILDAGQTFNFLPLPTDVHFGCGIAGSLPDHVRAIGGRQAFVVTDPGVRAAGIVDRVTAGLERAAISFSIYDNVTADSGSTLICDAVAALKASGADVVVGLGGGSALDTGKGGGGACHQPGLASRLRRPPQARESATADRSRCRRLPEPAARSACGRCSPTMSGSSRSRSASVLLYPAVALCDPELTLDLPAALTASTGLDALAHAIECYTNNACQPMSAALALEAIRLIGAHLRSAALNGRNRQARYAMMLASTMAGMAMNPTRLGLAHALAMPLGSWDLKIPHGVAIAVTLPVVMEFNCTGGAGAFRRGGPRAWRAGRWLLRRRRRRAGGSGSAASRRDDRDSERAVGVRAGRTSRRRQSWRRR